MGSRDVEEITFEDTQRQYQCEDNKQGSPKGQHEWFDWVVLGEETDKNGRCR